MLSTKNSEILHALANGVDPVTGEVLPESSPYNNPAVIRALYHALDLHCTLPNRLGAAKKTLAQRQAENLSRGMPENAGLS